MVWYKYLLMGGVIQKQHTTLPWCQSGPLKRWGKLTTLKTTQINLSKFWFIFPMTRIILSWETSWEKSNTGFFWPSIVLFLLGFLLSSFIIWLIMLMLNNIIVSASEQKEYLHKFLCFDNSSPVQRIQRKERWIKRIRSGKIRFSQLVRLSLFHLGALQNWLYKWGRFQILNNNQALFNMAFGNRKIYGFRIYQC